jgi:non-specific serine/threonine protein kinase
MARLAIFPATFTLEMAEIVVGADGDGAGSTLEALGSLAAAGLVGVRRTAAGPRYELEPRTRAEAHALLAARGELDETHRRLLVACQRFAGAAEAGMRGPDQERWLAVAALEADAIAASIEFAVRDGDAGRATELAGAFWRYWYSSAELAEGRRLLGLALGAKGRAGAAASESARARALLGAGVIARHQGDLEAAIRFFHEHLALARLGGDDRAIAQAHNSLAGALHQSGQPARARQLLLASLDWWERTRDRQGMASALSNLGVVASDVGELEAAREFGEQALALRLALGNGEDIAISCENLATVALRAGDEAEARRMFREALRRYAELDELEGVANALDGLALLVDDGAAARIMGFADQLRERSRAPRTGDTATRIAARRAALPAVDPTPEQPSVAAAVELALAASDGDDAGPVARRLQSRLTLREREVLALVTAGWTSKEIAARIGRSARTVEHHLANVYAKLGARGRADAIAFGIRMGLAE